MADLSDANLLLLPDESGRGATEPYKTRVLIQVIPQWTVSTKATALGTSCRLPHYSFSIEAPDAPTDSQLVKTVKKKVEITMDALTHHSIQNRLKLSHERKELIHPRADYDNYVGFLKEAACQTGRYLDDTGPLEASVTIEVGEGRTGTAGSCDYSLVKRLLSPLTVNHTAPVKDSSFTRLASLRLKDIQGPGFTDEAWREARKGAGRELRIPKDQTLVNGDVLEKYCVNETLLRELSEAQGGRILSLEV